MYKKLIKQKLNEWGLSNLNSFSEKTPTEPEVNNVPDTKNLNWSKLELSVFDAVDTVISQVYKVELRSIGKKPKDVVTIFSYDGCEFDLKLNIDQFIPENQYPNENQKISISNAIARGMNYNGIKDIHLSTGEDKIYMKGKFGCEN